MKLQPGDMFEYFEGEKGQHEVVRVSDCSAIVRPLEKRHAVIEQVEGPPVEFDAPARHVTISRNSSVRIVGKKTPAKLKKRKGL